MTPAFHLLWCQSPRDLPSASRLQLADLLSSYAADLRKDAVQGELHVTFEAAGPHDRVPIEWQASSFKPGSLAPEKV